MAGTKRRRNTKQRQVVLEAVRDCDWHPTVAEIYETVRRRLPRISLGTVYRNLETLVEMGAVRKLDGGSAGARFDGITDRHYHIRCITCGRLDNIEGLPEVPVPRETLARGGWRVTEQHFELLGECGPCRAVGDSAAAGGPGSGAVNGLEPRKQN